MLDGRVIVITGGTSGIGEAVAQLFADEGARVLIAGRREDRGHAVVEQIVSKGGEAAYFRADMTREDDITAMVAEAVRRWGRLDYAFNNAGMFGPEKPFHEFEDDVWHDWLTLNLTGVFRAMKYELRAMLETADQRTNDAVIVNNASIMGHRGSPYAGAAYAASKHGVVGLTRQAAIEYAGKGIRVNSVSPGPTLTEITAHTQDMPEAAYNKLIGDLLPIGRMGKVEEVAAAALFLCSDGASMITGHDLPVDGGQLAKL